MTENPGSPQNSDPEETTPEQAETAAAEAQEAQEAQSADLDAELQDLVAEESASSPEAELAERTEDLQRITAEYANYRRRTERERAVVIATAKASVVEKFIPVLDDLDLAEQHGDLKEGPLKAFADKFKGIVDAQSLTAFGAEGDAFDPEIHEAVQDLSEGDEKVIGTVLRKGYMVGDRLVRTAMVIIADPKA